MTDERHYSEEEISAIFEQAIDAQEAARRQLPNPEGLSLDELKKIGGDLGITAEFIALAAAKLDNTAPIAASASSILGIPFAVERVVDLPRALTDHEWDRLVVDLRYTFNAKGKIERSGSLRQWTNGNLQALIEPSGAGYQLRMRTQKGSAKETIQFSAVMTAMGLLLLGIFLASEVISEAGPAFVLPVMMLSMAAFSYGYSRLTVPRWHRTRGEQMDALADRVLEIVSEPVGNVPAIEERAPLIDLDEVADFEEDSTAVRSNRLTRD